MLQMSVYRAIGWFLEVRYEICWWFPMKSRLHVKNTVHCYSDIVRIHEKNDMRDSDAMLILSRYLIQGCF